MSQSHMKGLLQSPVRSQDGCSVSCQVSYITSSQCTVCPGRAEKPGSFCCDMRGAPPCDMSGASPCPSSGEMGIQTLARTETVVTYQPSAADTLILSCIRCPLISVGMQQACSPMWRVCNVLVFNKFLFLFGVSVIKITISTHCKLLFQH